MGFFGFGKKDKVIDLSEKYRRRQEEQTINNSKTQPRTIETKSDPIQTGMFGVFDSSQTQNQIGSMPTEASTGESAEERRKKFVKKITEMTERLDTLSTSLYHLSQRVELLEKKMNVGY